MNGFTDICVIILVTNNLLAPVLIKHDTAQSDASNELYDTHINQPDKRNDSKTLIYINMHRAIKITLISYSPDPYSNSIDPGESYREHCERIQGHSTKSYLGLPKFWKERKLLSSGGSQQVGNGAQSLIRDIQVKVMDGGVDQHGQN